MARNILVLCTGNSCRSQMAEGFLRQYLPEDHIYSAGIEAHGLNPLAVRVMSEVGIDISRHTSKLVESLTGINWDIVITVCDNAREQCPVFPGQHVHIHASFTDPAAAKGTEEEVLPLYRQVRDAIKAFSIEFAWGTPMPYNKKAGHHS